MGWERVVCPPGPEGPLDTCGPSAVCGRHAAVSGGAGRGGSCSVSPGSGQLAAPSPAVRPAPPRGGKRARLGRRVPTASAQSQAGLGGVVKPPLWPTATRGQWQVQPPPPRVRGPRGRDVWRRREGARPAVLSPWDEAPIPAPTPPAPAAREARGDASCPNVSRSVRCGPLKPLCLAK